MKNKILRRGIYSLAIIVFLLINNLSAQEIQPTNSEKSYLYVSAAFVSSNAINEGTVDPFYSAGTNVSADNVGRFDVGIRFKRNVSVEVGYTQNSLWLTRKLSIDDQMISAGGSSNSRISFYSAKIKHHLYFYKNRLMLNTGIGYALGNSTVSLNQFGPSNPNTITSFGNDITYTRSSEGLHSGSSNFITFDLGLEVEVYKRFSLFSNISIYKGFKDLQKQTYDYNINGVEGSFTSTTDGSFVALEWGVKYSFR